MNNVFSIFSKDTACEAIHLSSDEFKSFIASTDNTEHLNNCIDCKKRINILYSDVFKALANLADEISSGIIPAGYRVIEDGDVNRLEYMDDDEDA